MRTRLAIGFLIFALAGATAHAGSDGKDMRIQFGLLNSSPNGDLTQGTQTLELTGETGLQVSFETMVTERIGIEPGLAMLSHEVDVSDSAGPNFTLGEADLLQVTANVNFHLLSDEKKFDLFVGPTVGYAMWGDLETSLFATDFGTDDEIFFGGNIGIDVPFNEGRWSFTGGLSYLLLDLSLDGGTGDLGVDPIQLRAGVSYRF